MGDEFPGGGGENLMTCEPPKGWSGTFFRSCSMTGNVQPLAIEEHRAVVPSAGYPEKVHPGTGQMSDL